MASLTAGVIVFFIIFAVFNFYFLPLIQKKVQRIGYFGTYRTSNLPNSILSDVSYGLTKVESDGSIKPAAAFKWDVKDGGKEYVFYIRKGQYFNNNKELTARTINFSFKDASLKVIDNYTIELTLKKPYAPFLASVAKPILLKNFSGLGNYKVTSVELNGGFVKSIHLQDKKRSEYKKIIYFYPTQEALKMAYALGEIDIAPGVSDLGIKNTSFQRWTNTKISKQVNHDELLTMFYNNADSFLSDKKVRQALNYALPAEFTQGERSYSPISPSSVFFSEGPNYGITDPAISKSLLEDNPDVKKKVFEISAPEEYEKEALQISKAWKEIGINSKVKIVSRIPDNFQILIYMIKLPRDPDQYTLWHSNGINNIINYKKNQRIDKLLEDGRSTNDQETRVSIYADFQKYFMDDVPASFLYYPYLYTLTRI